jgi:hypothetical protein
MALYWQQRGEGRDGDAEKTAMVARLLADASTSLQRGQYSVIMALARQCRRVDPLTGAEPRSWQPLEVGDFLSNLTDGAR